MLMGFRLNFDRFIELERRMRMLHAQNVKVGMFDTSKHGDSNWTNVGLFKYLHNGDDSNNIPSRPILTLAFSFNPLSKNKILKKTLREYFSNISKNKSQKDADKILKNLGQFYRDSAFSLMGDPVKIAANSLYTQKLKAEKGLDSNSPFVEYGLLRKKISYQIHETVYEYGGN